MDYTLTWITKQLAVGQAPMSYEELDSIKEQGIGAIVNLCGEFSDLHEIEEKAGFEVYHLPVHDECAPELEHMERALHWFDEAIYLNKKILVHCRHGIGRTGTFVSAYLLRRGLGLKLAEKTLKTTRATPTNYQQWKLLRKYSKEQGKLTVRSASVEDTRAVDLAPFFEEYLAIIHEGVGRGKPDDRESFDPERCCNDYFELQLVEATYVSHAMNILLTSTERQEVIHSTLALAKEMEISGPSQGPEELSARKNRFQRAQVQCPLLKDGTCMIFRDRPLHCRQLKKEVTPEHLVTMIENLSRDVYFSLTSVFPPESTLHFSMLDTLSGRFVQQYFQSMLKTQETTT
ncbi:MAG: dual specificity protein phosphatase family protein [Thermodesulfobacteriota bacterium]